MWIIGGRMELRIIGQVELVVSEPVWHDAHVDLLYVPKVPIYKGKILAYFYGAKMLLES